MKSFSNAIVVDGAEITVHAALYRSGISLPVMDDVGTRRDKASGSRKQADADEAAATTDRDALDAGLLAFVGLVQAEVVWQG